MSLQDNYLFISFGERLYLNETICDDVTSTVRGWGVGGLVCLGWRDEECTVYVNEGDYICRVSACVGVSDGPQSSGHRADRVNLQLL